MGLYGACRRIELLNMTLDHIDNREDILIVTVPQTKNNIPRTFTITNNTIDGLNLLTVYKKYVSLRPPQTQHNRLFVYYRNNKCTAQPIGKNTFGQIPRKIATYLKLPEPSTYTGHCFRRSSATLLANSGSDMLTLKRHGGWRSTAVAEGYIGESLSNKINISQRILTNQEQLPSTSRSDTTALPKTSIQAVNHNNTPYELSSSSTEVDHHANSYQTFPNPIEFTTSSVEVSHHASTSNTYQMPSNSGITIHNCAHGIINVNYYNK